MNEDWDAATGKYASYLRFERSMSPNTTASYLRDVKKLRDFAAANGGAVPAEIESGDIEAFMAEVYDRGLNAASQARLLSALKSFFRFMQLEGVRDDSPLEFIDSPRLGRHLPDTLSVDEVDAVLSAIDLSADQGHRNRAMIETLYSCGLRVTELVSLTLADLFFDEGFVRVTGKGDKQRLVPLSDEARRTIQLYLEQRRAMSVDARSADVVFLNRRGRRLSRVMVFNIIKQAVALAGIAKTVSPHTFRHSFATHLLEGGAGIRQVQELLGHESILTTEIYTHLDRTHLHRSVERHHPLG